MLVLLVLVEHLIDAMQFAFVEKKVGEKMGRRNDSAALFRE